MINNRLLLSIRHQIGRWVPKYAVTMLLKLRYLGSRYRCPLCNSNISLFLQMPDRFRVNLVIYGREYTPYHFETFHVEQYLCPVCYSTDRDRLYALFFNKLLKGADNGKKLIHFAPEKELSKFIKKHLHFDYRTADLLMKDVDDIVDITNLNIYQTASIDCFMCSHILEHIPDDTKALGELFRILNPDGWGIIMVPIIPDLQKTYEDFSKTTDEERLKHFGQGDHVRVYGKRDFIDRISDSGFVVRQVGLDSFGQEVFERAGITPKSVLYVVAKKNDTFQKVFKQDLLLRR